jgi:hypothetical protein
MKTFFTLICAGFLTLSSNAQTGIQEVINGLQANNSGQVARYFDNTVDITLSQKGNSYSKSQAEVILRDFLATNPVKGFQTIHKGDNAGSQYCIGKLATKNGSFRTTIFMKQRGDKQFLQEIRFENE